LTAAFQLFGQYQLEGLTMPYTVEQFEREVAQRVLQELSVKERLAGLTPEQMLAAVPPEQLLAAMPPEQRLAGLTPEQIKAYLQQLEGKPGEQENN
jgi:hypothetical protein